MVIVKFGEAVKWIALPPVKAEEFTRITDAGDQLDLSGGQLNTRPESLNYRLVAVPLEAGGPTVPSATS